MQKVLAYSPGFCQSHPSRQGKLPGLTSLLPTMGIYVKMPGRKIRGSASGVHRFLTGPDLRVRGRVGGAGASGGWGAGYWACLLGPGGAPGSRIPLPDPRLHLRRAFSACVCLHPTFSFCEAVVTLDEGHPDGFTLTLQRSRSQMRPIHRPWGDEDFNISSGSSEWVPALGPAHRGLCHSGRVRDRNESTVADSPPANA